MVCAENKELELHRPYIEIKIADRKAQLDAEHKHARDKHPPAFYSIKSPGEIIAISYTKIRSFAEIVYLP
jgi:hypothetical protein